MSLLLRKQLEDSELRPERDVARLMLHLHVCEPFMGFNFIAQQP